MGGGGGVWGRGAGVGGGSGICNNNNKIKTKQKQMVNNINKKFIQTHFRQFVFSFLDFIRIRFFFFFFLTPLQTLVS